MAPKDLLTSPDDYRKAAEKCLRLVNGARAPVIKRLLRERAELLNKTAAGLERAETATADIPERKGEQTRKRSCPDL